MASESLVFRCPSCGIKLAVPVQRAGVSGPCPACGCTIQSPVVAALPLTGAHVAVSMHASTLTAGGVPMPGVASQPPVPTETANPPLDRPEARPLPGTTILHASESITLVGSMWNASHPPAAGRRRPRHPWRRLLLALVLLAAAALACYLLLRPF